MSTHISRPIHRYALAARGVAAGGAAALACAFVLVAVLASVVLGASPRRLATQITDDVNALGGGKGAVQRAIDDLQRAANVQLWVWFTDTTGDLSAADFATETAALSGLGGNDFLLVVAITDRSDGYSTSDSIPISHAQLDSIIGADLEPALQAGDNSGAIVATAAGIRDAIAGPTTGPAATTGVPAATTGPVATGSTGGGAGSTGSTGGSPLGTLLTVLLIVGLIAVAGWWVLYRWKRPSGASGTGGVATAGAPVDDIAAMKTPDLEKLANQALVETDDAVRDSDQELGFAQAQFGDADIAPFQAAITDAKADLAAAFKLRQQLDDSIPEDAATHRRILEALVRGCRHAQDRLDAVKDEFERLREIEAKAPQILAALPAQADALEARLPGAQQAMTHLAVYADASWQSVAPNIDEARKRLAAVREAVGEGEKAIAASNTQTAARAARLGQDALGQGTAFLDGIDRLARELDETKAKVDQMLVEADRDLTQARAAASGAAASGSADQALAGRLAQADALLSGARLSLAGPKPDVAAAYRQASDANTIADDSLAALRTAAEQRARDAARLDASIKAAQATLTRATDFVATRRGAVGTEARTRLAEAERHLTQAVAAGANDPVGGTREADEATRLANMAYQAAQADYGRYDDPWHGGRGGGGGGGGGAGIGGDIAGAIIGGIIGGMLSGGGRGGGLGGLGGGGGFGGGWGGGRSSGGGSFGGGGGRSSGGGRW